MGVMILAARFERVTQTPSHRPMSAENGTATTTSEKVFMDSRQSPVTAR